MSDFDFSLAKRFSRLTLGRAETLNARFLEVAEAIATKLDKSGGAITGNFSTSGTFQAGGAATIGGALEIHGDLTMNGGRVKMAGNATDPQDLVTLFQLNATAFSNALPSQALNAGKFVTTDGVNAYWATLVIPGHATEAEAVEGLEDTKFLTSLTTSQVLDRRGFAIGDLMTTTRIPNAVWRAADGSTLLKSAYPTLATKVGSLFDGNFTKLANPATLPTGAATGVAWSPDGRYMAVSHAMSPFVTIYDWATGVPVKMANPATLPTSAGAAVAWSPNGKYLAVNTASTPFIVLYDMTSGVPVKMADPAVLPGGAPMASAVSGMDFSADSRYLAIAHSGAPYITVYDFDTGTPVKLANPVGISLTDGYGVAWSPTGRNLVLTTSSIPGLALFDVSTGVLVSKSVASSLPNVPVYSASWSPNGKYVAIVGLNGATTYSYVYRFLDKGDYGFQKVSDPGAVVSGAMRGCAWSADSQLLTIGFTGSPQTATFMVDSSEVFKHKGLNVAPAGAVRGFKWSPKTPYIAFACDTTPFINIYGPAYNVATEFVLPNIKPGFPFTTYIKAT